MFAEVEDQTEFTEKIESQTSPGEGQFLDSLSQADGDRLEQGRMINDAVNNNISSFNPDIMLEQLSNNFSLARSMYGDSLIRRITGFDPRYVKKNIQIPEFYRELKSKLEEGVEKLRQENLIDTEGSITDTGYELASLVLYMEELDNIIPKGTFGQKIHKKSFIYGDRADPKQYRKGDRFRDISLRKSLKMAIRRKHSRLNENDLVSMERKSRGKLAIVYALDASGSMKGSKIELCKKAGIALAYKAIDDKDEVGLLVFGTEIKEKIRPTTDFPALLRSIARVRASMQTNIAETIRQSIDMFPPGNVTRHMVLLTDALPTFGQKPEEETLEAVSLARNAGITLSLIGINLDRKGEAFAKRIVETGEGRFYVAKNLKQLDKILLEDYYAMI